MPSTYSTRSRGRPLGVTILCIVAGLGALRTVALSLGILSSPTLFGLLGLVPLVLAVGKLLVLLGLWTLRAWGLKWAVAIYTISALRNLLGVNSFGLIIDVVIVVYLLIVADHFR